MAEISKNPVLYLSYDGLTDPLGQSQVLPYVIGLINKGWQFTIISFEKRAAFESGGKEIQSICAQHGIRWIPLRYHKSPPIVSTVFDLWQLSRKVKSILNKKSNYIIHCRSYLTSLVGLGMKAKFGSHFIFDMRGFWADERVEGGLWNIQNPIYKHVYKFFKRKEKELISGASHLISLTYNAKREMESWNIKTAPITVIPTCVDLELFNPANITEAEQQTLRQKLDIAESDFVLLYLGSWGTWYMMDEMLTYFSRIKQIKPNAKFLIVTPDKVPLDGFKHQRDVRVTKSVRTMVPLHISLAHKAIFFYKPTFNRKASSATKLGELLAMKKKVITNSGWGDVDQLNYGDWVYVMDITKPFSFDWIDSQPKTPIDLKSLSLTEGVERYNKVYESL